MSAPAFETATDLHCPMCEYDLRGQVEPRCPECGYRFTWEELRDPRRRLHPYLFEHHPERNIWSFVMTLLGSWLPRKFWRNVAPTQPSRPKRLLIYHLVIVVLALIPALAILVALGYEFDAFNASQKAMYLTRGWSPSFRGQSLPQWLAVNFPPFPSMDFFDALLRRKNVRLFMLAQGLILGWPWMTIATLLIFQVSMQRRRIRAVHMARCVIYSSDLVLIPAALAASLVLMKANELQAGGPPASMYWDVAGPLACVGLLILPVFCYRLYMAIALYLRFDRPLATLAAVQTIVALAATILVVQFLLIPYP